VKCLTEQYLKPKDLDDVFAWFPPIKLENPFQRK
jgi:hypothetical protein